MFRVGSKNGFTLYWSDPIGELEDRFLGTATSPEMATAITDALNAAYDPAETRPPQPVRYCPIVPRVVP